MKKNLLLLSSVSLLLNLQSCTKEANYKTNLSGVYPRLAFYNEEGECGTGAVVPWAGSLWAITYGPHKPFGSSDKLYQITTDKKLIVRSESIGGTPANRMIHRESNQLFIGPYVVDSIGDIRVIPYSKMPGRHTGNARHLADSENKIYYATMEEGFYSIDVKTLDVDTLYIDGNKIPKKKGELSQHNELLPGSHGKGFYSGQGVAVYSNNGEATYEALHKFDVEAGVLAEWNGKDWTIVRRNQFVEVTGPGGIYGNSDPSKDPIWTTGWDYKSVILGVREFDKGWTFYRLPKASHSYDGAHGWNTEWPRIRNIGTETDKEYLMTMHGMFWHFPESFTSRNSAGVRPRSAYLKVIGDFARWNDELVFGCDDSAKNEFLNTRKAKGGIEGPGQSNSNLWFTSLSKPDELGPNTSDGSVWENEVVDANTYSDPFLFAGWDNRCCWLSNLSNEPVSFVFEKDNEGNNQWKEFKHVTINSNSSCYLPFDLKETGEWIRIKLNKKAKVTASFVYSQNDNRTLSHDKIFEGLAKTDSDKVNGGLLYSLGDNRRNLGVLANEIVNGHCKETGYYELNESLQLIRKEDKNTSDFIRTKFTIPSNVINVEESSILIVDDKNRRWRLPLGKNKFNELTNGGLLRICREVATERDLFSCHGTFYELPAENADGFAKIRPISTHNFLINDYASYRGLLVLTGISTDLNIDNEHIIKSNDGKAAVWAGAIDDLWKLGKPVGHGGPWKNTSVSAGEYSDPYLIGFYDKKTLKLSHDSNEVISFRIEVDPNGNGNWMYYSTVSVKPGETFVKQIDREFSARWIRFSIDKTARTTAFLDYE